MHVWICVSECVLGGEIFGLLVCDKVVYTMIDWDSGTGRGGSACSMQLPVCRERSHPMPSFRHVGQGGLGFIRGYSQMHIVRQKCNRKLATSECFCLI